jgi:hypothetical protein
VAGGQIVGQWSGAIHHPYRRTRLRNYSLVR